MSDSNNIPARKPRADKGGIHRPMTAERKAKFIEGCRKSASYRAAARYATPGATNGTNNNALSSFRREMQVDPDFAAEVAAAMDDALGRLEETLMERAFVPDRRIQRCPKTGVVIGESEGWEPANRLGRALLARHLPEWVEQQKRQVEGHTTVTHVGGGSGQGGIGFVITPALTATLNDDEKRQLGDLMRAMMTRSEEQKQLEQQRPTESEQQ